MVLAPFDRSSNHLYFSAAHFLFQIRHSGFALQFALQNCFGHLNAQSHFIITFFSADFLSRAAAAYSVSNFCARLYSVSIKAARYADETEP